MFFANGATLSAAQREQLVARAIGVVNEPVVSLAGEGLAAAIAINNDLVDEDLPIAVASFRLGLPV